MTAQALTDLGAAEFTIGIQVTPVFEIVRVDEGTGPNSSGGRYGAIETFGIQLKDDGDAGTSGKTFTNIDLGNWEQGEYMFWGNYQPDQERLSTLQTVLQTLLFWMIFH